MKINKINLNYYSFGFLGGFVDKSIKNLSLEKFIEISKKNNLGGIEFPIDYLFKNNYDDINSFFNRKNEFNVFKSIENFEFEIIKKMIPILKLYGINKARIKMSNHFGGNRYKIKSFKNEFQEFIRHLKLLKPLLLEYDFKLLIENHQDLNSHDILYIIEKISNKCIGINWDIGNSLPTGETPMQFYRNIKDHIYNIHIKDYHIEKNNDSLEFHRSIIGNGNIGIKKILKVLNKDNYCHSMSIELGAHKKRVSNIYKKEYWKAYKCYNKKHRLEYNEFLNENMISSEGITIKNDSPSKELEIFQIEQSVINLRNIN